MPSHQPVALVTGASSGMGRDFALRLLSEGYLVYGAPRRTDRMADLSSAGCDVVALNVTNDASMVAAVTTHSIPAKFASNERESEGSDT